EESCEKSTGFTVEDSTGLLAELAPSRGLIHRNKLLMFTFGAQLSYSALSTKVICVQLPEKWSDDFEVSKRVITQDSLDFVYLLLDDVTVFNPYNLSHQT
ncbi:hypothetical protein PFISCL1PPCAC_29036, partial [Pristionchus fissidentatus]